jgi:hypothetical protein
LATSARLAEPLMGPSLWFFFIKSMLRGKFMESAVAETIIPVGLRGRNPPPPPRLILYMYMRVYTRARVELRSNPARFVGSIDVARDIGVSFSI